MTASVSGSVNCVLNSRTRRQPVQNDAPFRNPRTQTKESMLLALVLSLLFDLFGEPPSRLHPVVWMGRYLEWVRKRNFGGTWRTFWQGAAYLTFGIFVVTSTAWLAASVLNLFPFWFSIPATALLLKPMFSLRALLRAGEEVKQALLRKDLLEARHLLSWHLVSRDTTALAEHEVAGAAVESLAENLTDSVIAPLFYFALFGLPGAALYRFVNTADAVLGYRTPELEYFGKSAARLDDALNLVPARLSAVLLYIVLGISRHHPTRGLNAALSATLPSPNAHWTMALVAGGLGVRLDKRGVYVLNSGGELPSTQDIVRTQRLLISAAALGVVSCVGLVYA